MSEEVMNVIEEVQIPVEEIEDLIPEEAVINEVTTGKYGPKVAAVIAVAAGLVMAGVFIKKKLRAKKEQIEEETDQTCCTTEDIITYDEEDTAAE